MYELIVKIYISLQEKVYLEFLKTWINMDFIFKSFFEQNILVFGFLLTIKGPGKFYNKLQRESKKSGCVSKVFYP